jgi:hypothetical protein
MSKYFSPLVDRYFINWLSLPTWDSMHPLDMQRFYQFLKAMRLYSRSPWQIKFRENIIKAAKKLHPNLQQEYIVEIADVFMHHAEIAFAYDAAGIDPIVEMRSPHAVALSLRILEYIDEKGNNHPIYTQEQIEKILIENFGEDWRSSGVVNTRKAKKLPNSLV